MATTIDSSFDLTITASVINATGPKASVRLKEVFGNLVQHLHDFCRESKITRVEFHQALQMVSYVHPASSLNP